MVCIVVVNCTTDRLVGGGFGRHVPGSLLVPGGHGTAQPRGWHQLSVRKWVRWGDRGRAAESKVLEKSMKVITAGLATSPAQGKALPSFVPQPALQIGLSIKIGTCHQPVQNFQYFKHFVFTS